jgi:hypothetical protein
MPASARRIMTSTLHRRRGTPAPNRRKVWRAGDISKARRQIVDAVMREFGRIDILSTP